MSLYDVAQMLTNEYRRTPVGQVLAVVSARREVTRSALPRTSDASRNSEKSRHQRIHLAELRAAKVLAEAIPPRSTQQDVRCQNRRPYASTTSTCFPANALFELGETYGLMPRTSGSDGRRDERFAILEPKNGYMASVLAEWAEKYHALDHDEISRDDYERWKDRFSEGFDPADFPLRYSRSDNGFAAIEPWRNVQFANTLQRLRKKQRVDAGGTWTDQRLRQNCDTCL